MKLQIATKEQIIFVKSLYESAFPAEEKKPFWLIRRHQKRGVAEIMAVIGEPDEFLGLVIVLKHQDLILLDYLAIADSARGQGVGSQVLALLKERYPSQRLVLEIEKVEESADNYEQRKSRKHFYLKNGLDAEGLFVRVYGVDMELLTYNGSVSFHEYHNLLLQTLGKLIVSRLKPVCLEESV